MEWKRARRLCVPDPTHFSCPGRLEQVQHLTAHLKRCCTDRHVPDAALVDLELALVEAANNIVLHGYAGRSDGVIHLQVRLEDGMVALELSDDGAPMQEGLLLACRPFSLEGERRTRYRYHSILHRPHRLSYSGWGQSSRAG